MSEHTSTPSSGQQTHSSLTCEFPRQQFLPPLRPLYAFPMGCVLAHATAGVSRPLPPMPGAPLPTHSWLMWAFFSLLLYLLGNGGTQVLPIVGVVTHTFLAKICAFIVSELAFLKTNLVFLLQCSLRDLKKGWCLSTFSSQN